MRYIYKRNSSGGLIHFFPNYFFPKVFGLVRIKKIISKKNSWQFFRCFVSEPASVAKKIYNITRYKKNNSLLGFLSIFRKMLGHFFGREGVIENRSVGQT